MVKLLIVMLTALFLLRITHAYTEKFEIVLDKNLVISGKEFEAAFVNSRIYTGTEYYKVRPLAGSGKVYIWDNVNNEWVLNTKPWSAMPKISETMRVKISDFEKDTDWLVFEILDTRTSRKFETEPIKIRGNVAIENYLPELNRNIAGFGPSADPSENVSAKTAAEQFFVTESGVEKLADINSPMASAYLPLSVFILMTIFSYLYFYLRSQKTKTGIITSIV